MTELIVMRLADMVRVHPDQITGKCRTCGHDVGIFPSGQRVLQQDPTVELVCQVCRSPGQHAVLAPGAEREPFQSQRKQ